MKETYTVEDLKSMAKQLRLTFGISYALAR